MLLGAPDQPIPSAPVSVVWSLVPGTPTASGGPVLTLPTPLAAGDQVGASGVLSATGPALSTETPTPTPSTDPADAEHHTEHDTEHDSHPEPDADPHPHAHSTPTPDA